METCKSCLSGFSRFNCILYDSRHIAYHRPRTAPVHRSKNLLGHGQNACKLRQYGSYNESHGLSLPVYELPLQMLLLRKSTLISLYRTSSPLPLMILSLLPSDPPSPHCSSTYMLPASCLHLGSCCTAFAKRALSVNLPVTVREQRSINLSAPF